MTTPTHITVNLGAFILLIQINSLSLNYVDLLLITTSNLIDLDHLFSRPIYHPKRNPFKTHFIHKRYKLVLLFSVIILFIRPLMFLGIGLILHLFLDYLYIKREKV